SKVLMAAFAAGAVSLAYPTIWQLSATMGPWRLSAATILASCPQSGVHPQVAEVGQIFAQTFDSVVA
ncbi:MAG TPA: hypothetical protein VF328_10300, partial [Mycobacterium sp.]